MKTVDDIISSGSIWDFHELPFGNVGMIKLPDCGTCSIVWGNDEDGWEHVSVSPKKKFNKAGLENLPTWNDMCALKDIFFYPGEEAYQIHPKKKEYVNFQSNCLHLWKPIGHELAETLCLTETLKSCFEELKCEMKMRDEDCAEPKCAVDKGYSLAVEHMNYEIVKILSRFRTEVTNEKK